MKLKYDMMVLAMLCSLSVFGQQQQKAVAQSNTVQTVQTSVPDLQKEILQLRQENQMLQQKLDRVESDLKVYRDDVRTKIGEFDDDMSHWLTLLSIILGSMMTIIGVVVPFLMNMNNNNRLKERFEEIKRKVDEATKLAGKAEEAINVVSDLKTQFLEIEANINQSKVEADESAKEAKASQLFAQALSENDLNRKIEFYSQAIELNPKFAEAYNNRGNAKSNMKRYEEAIEDYDKAIGFNPNFAEAYNNRGNTKFDMKRYEEAIEDYGKAIGLNPNYAEAYYNRGNAKSDMKRYKEAIEDYGKAIGLNPNFAEAYNNRAMAYLEQNEYKLALDDVEKAISIDSTNACAYDTRGEILSAMGEYAKALSNYHTAITINASCKEAYYNRAKCYRKLAEKEQDVSKKAEYLTKAEADEKKAESLR